MKTKWDLTVFYKNEEDPKIESDILAIEKAYSDFEKKYKNKKDYLENEDSLVKALEDWDTLLGVAGSWKPAMYLNYRKDLDSFNQKADSLFNKVVNRLTVASNKILFFNLALGKIDKKLQTQFLSSDKLAPFRYYLKRIFDTAKYDLGESEEKILNLKSLPAREMWSSNQEKLLNSQTIKFEGKELPIPEASNKIFELPKQKRYELQQLLSEKLKSISYFAEAELNAIYTDKKIDDELRGFGEPYSATILGYQNNEKSIITFVDTVTKNFPISHKFYKLKARLLKLPRLRFPDRSVSIGKNSKKVGFEEGLNIFKKALGNVDEKYVKILDHFIENGQIDVYPVKGKRGGAYCSHSTGNPTFVLLNQVDSIDSIMTLGHEMGHAFHSELSKVQRPIYQDYTISVAEVASTLFENFVFEELLRTMSEKEKIVALHDRIEDDIKTIFRQIACFNFELELHRSVQTDGAITKEEIAKTHNKYMKAYLGNIFDLKEDDGYFFVPWPHLRYFFYVYSYAYGQLISKALYKKYQGDKDFIKQIEKFLSAGGSKSPEDIFKEIGIDTSKPEFFLDGLRSIEEDIKRLEKLAKSAKLV